MSNQEQEQRMRQYLDDTLFIFMNDSALQFEKNHMPLFKAMGELFRTLDPRKLFGLDCFKNKESVCDAQHILVCKYQRERDVKRGKLVNQLADLLTDKVPGDCNRYANFIKELRVQAPSKSLAQEEVEKCLKSALNGKAMADKASAQDAVAEKLLHDEHQHQINGQQEDVPTPKKKHVFLPSAKENEQPKEQHDDGPDPNGDIPKYLGDVNRPTLFVGLHNAHREHNQRERPVPQTPFVRGERVQCPNCKEFGHRPSRCPNGGTIRWKKDGSGEREFLGGRQKCFVCGAKEGNGHFSLTCPWRHPDAQWGNCFNCASSGHKARDCTVPRRGPQPRDFPILPPTEMREKDSCGRFKKLSEQFPGLIAEQQKHNTSIRVFVGRLHRAVTEADLREFLNGFKIKSVQMKEKGYAFVDFYEIEEAKNACYYRSGQLLFGQPIVMEKAKPLKNPNTA